jgi:hypothetical protein
VLDEAPMSKPDGRSRAGFLAVLLSAGAGSLRGRGSGCESEKERNRD